MFKRVLVANRGEIAVRIIRALHDLQVKAIAVYSTADRESLHVRLADQAVCIGGPSPAQSYLNMQNIISAAILTGAEAIHPGFGFLSENAEFAELCQECGIVFIGPKPQTIRLLGDKINARQTMAAHDIPVIPGSAGFIETSAQASAVAAEIGYPIMLKAAAGGGGKGIRQLASPEEVEQQFESAQKEAVTSFGDGRMYIEKVIAPAKHIEVQVLGDGQGQVIAFPERDCSLQRHHQKMLEETPCASLSAQQRQKLLALAQHAAQVVNYLNTGTLEFLMDTQQRVFFMEMNTRIQVEHPITEMVTGIDLIKAQLQVASGAGLPVTQDDVCLQGHALECRINAEDPIHAFRPCAGKIKALHLPLGGLGVRVDAGVTTGSVISPFYDSMIAKLVAHAPSRQEAFAIMERMLNEFSLEGIITNQQAQQALIQHPVVKAGTASTTFIEDVFLPTLTHQLNQED